MGMFLLASLLMSCSTSLSPAPTQISSSTAMAFVTASTQPAIFQTTETSTLSPEASTVFVCDEDWQSQPVIPVVTEPARLLYQQGLVNGNGHHAFSKIGDGEISTTWFLTDFDLGKSNYDLGDYQSLGEVIEYFQSSFERVSLSARRGFNTNLILDSSASNAALCNSGESPLDCELRIHNPSIAILSLGTNQVYRPEEFEAGIRKIINVLLENHVLPILSTKGDNLEGDHQINRTISCLAQEYQIPLWNFWSVIQPLPNHGLQPDLEHLTYYGINDFNDHIAMQSAWTIRNLTALQVLDNVWRSVTK